MRNRIFLRTNVKQYKRLGKGRKKKQKWRYPRGRHSKIREHIRGKRMMPSIGFKQPSSKAIKIVKNLKEINALNKGEKVIIAHIGKKKKMEMIKIAKEKGIEVLN